MKNNIRSIRASDPIALKGFHIVGPIECVQTLKQFIGKVIRFIFDLVVKIVKAIFDTIVKTLGRGEEIAIILPSTNIDETEVAAERLRKKIEKSSFETDSAKPLKATISLGLAEWADSMADEKTLIASADKALYKAKETGRNRYCIST